MFQVAPVAIADGIAQVAARVLTKDGFLAIYGPFKVDGRYTTPSNESFDKEILAANVAEWGLKDVISRRARRIGRIMSRKTSSPNIAASSIRAPAIAALASPLLLPTAKRDKAGHLIDLDRAPRANGRARSLADPSPM